MSRPTIKSMLTILALSQIMDLKLVKCLPEEPKVTYSLLYKWGMEEYDEGNWYDAMTYMKRAQEDYDYFRGELLRCRVECDDQLPLTPAVFSGNNDKSFFFPVEFTEAAIMDRFMKRSLCVEYCAQKRMTVRPKEYKDWKVEKAMEQLEPYSYAQFCYYQMDQIEHAVKHAYTYLVRNPGNQLMSENLGYYMKHNHFKEEHLVDLAERGYQKSFQSGVEAYEDKDYFMSIQLMRETLDSMWAEIRNCRLMCDETFDRNVENRMVHDWYSKIAMMYASILKCRLQCVDKLSYIRGNHIPDMLPLIYNYLQISYFHSDQLQMSCGAVETFLLLNPDDKNMKQNKQVYIKSHRASADLFVPDHNAVTFLSAHSADRYMLQKFQELFETDYSGAMTAPTQKDYEMLRIADLQSATAHGLYTNEEWAKFKSDDSDSETSDAEDEKLPEIHKVNFGAEWAPKASDIKLRNFPQFEITHKEGALNHSQRFMGEKLLTEDQCKTIMKIADFARPGDGYYGKKKPHGRHEQFEGVSVENMVKLVAEGKLNKEDAAFYLKATDAVAELLKEYFGLNQLYLDYTHLACRRVLSDNKNSDQLSHGIHGDNCFMDESLWDSSSKLRCIRKPPAFYWRDFTAMVYLNDDFEGGTFFFADDDGKTQDTARDKQVKTVKSDAPILAQTQATVSPRCGRLVGFHASQPHGVTRVIAPAPAPESSGTNSAPSGTRRCALAVWTTLDGKRGEPGRNELRKMLEGGR